MGFSTSQSQYQPLSVTMVAPSKNNHFVPPYWTDHHHKHTNNPFHLGEVTMQRQFGAQDAVMSYAPDFIRPFLPEQHVRFYEAQPFLVVAARDDQGHMWSTLLFADQPSGIPNIHRQDLEAVHVDDMSHFVTSPDPTRLVIRSRPLPGDALEYSLRPGSDLGILGIEFATRRRNRVNGRLVATQMSRRNPHNNVTDEPLLLEVDQSFGNCPQYIKPRQWWWNPVKTTTLSTTNEKMTTTTSSRSSALSVTQMEALKRAETFFLATGYRSDEDHHHNPRYGNDSSHRGGPPGFVSVPNPTTIIFPDYEGNKHFNTIGNLIMDSRIGMTFPQFGTGSMIQVTGTAEVIWDPEEVSKCFPQAGIQRVIKVTIQQVVELPRGSMPIRWSGEVGKAAAEEEEVKDDGLKMNDDNNPRNLQVFQKVQESKDVTSFYLKPFPTDDDSSPQPLWSFQAGQHLPITVQWKPRTDEADHFSQTPSSSADSELQRTYSLSSSPNETGYYRISVKRQNQGRVSQFLHDQVHVGDTLTVLKPTGDFVWDGTTNSVRDVVLVSIGIGVTPLLSMLYQFVGRPQATSLTNNSQQRHRPSAQRVFWIHGTQNRLSHAFRNEVNELQQLMGEDRLITHIVYSQPNEIEDHTIQNDVSYYDSTGRIDVSLLQRLVPDLTTNVDIYMCGTGAFMASMERGLMQVGVNPSRIRLETF